MTFLEDLGYAFRKLRKKPYFSLGVILILGIGMGATTAVLDLTNLLAWKKLPVPNPNEVVKVFTASQRGFVGPYNQTSYLDYVDYRDLNNSFSGLAAHTQASEIQMDVGTSTEQLTAMAVTGNFFEVLELNSSAGRRFQPRDDLLGSPPVMMIAYHRWKQLGADPGELGRTMIVNGEAFTVVGVAPASFSGIQAGFIPDAFFPMAAAPRVFGADMESLLEDRSRRAIDLIGRLEPTVKLVQAEADLGVIAQQIDLEHPLPGGVSRQLTATPARIVHPIDLFRLAPTLKLFAAAAILLLVITCANIAHLLLARSTIRRREWGVRQSMGASRGRLVRQVLTENLLLALGGGLVGLVVAFGSRVLLIVHVGPDFAREMSFDLRVLVSSLGVCLAVTLLLGLAPALGASRGDLLASLNVGASSSKQARFSPGKLLLAAQVAFCVVLLAVGGALAQGVWQRLHADLGFDDSELLIARFEMPEKEYSQEQEQSFVRELRSAVATLPMVEEVGLGLIIPPILFDLSLPFQLPEDPEEEKDSRFNFVDGGYFRAMGIPLEAGRLFDSREIEGEPVVVVDRLLADSLWPGQDPVGRTILSASRKPGGPGPEYRVIGVVGSVTQFRSTEGHEPVLYFSLAQRYRRHFKMVIKSSAGAGVVFEALRSVTKKMDAQLVPLSLTTGVANRREAFTIERMQAQAVAVFAMAGLLLAVLGIFGVLTYAVSCRVKEIGVRMAVGARERDVLWLIVGQGLRVILVGVVLGCLGALLSSRFLEQLLFGVGAADGRLLGGVIALVVLAGLAAAYFPARKASRLDPLEALHHD